MNCDSESQMSGGKRTREYDDPCEGDAEDTSVDVKTKLSAFRAKHSKQMTSGQGTMRLPIVFGLFVLRENMSHHKSRF